MLGREVAILSLYISTQLSATLRSQGIHTRSSYEVLIVVSVTHHVVLLFRTDASTMSKLLVYLFHESGI